MRQTIIGFFNSEAEAGYALDRLRTAGIPEAEIDFSGISADSAGVGDLGPGDESPYDVGDESRYPQTGTVNESTGNVLNEDRIRERGSYDYEEGKGDSIGRFFRRLFDNKEDAERFAEIGRRTCIVSVHAESTVEAERARDILDESGAVEVEHELPSVLNAESRSESPGREAGAAGRRRSHIVGRTVEDEFRLRRQGTQTGSSPAIPSSGLGGSPSAGSEDAGDNKYTNDREGSSQTNREL